MVVRHRSRNAGQPAEAGHYGWMNSVKLKIIAAGLLVLVPASCETAKQREDIRRQEEEKRNAESAKRHLESLEAIKKRFEIPVPTKEEDNLRKKYWVLYYGGLIQSIKSLDDSVSPADTIGRAAVSDNFDALRKWKTAAVAHYLRQGALERSFFDKLINSLPTQAVLDDATSLVLRNRKGTLGSLPEF